jgi:hypothetical protein
MSRLFLGFLKVFAKKLSPRRDATVMAVRSNLNWPEKKTFFTKTGFVEKFSCQLFVRGRCGEPPGPVERVF